MFAYVRCSPTPAHPSSVQSLPVGVRTSVLCGHTSLGGTRCVKGVVACFSTPAPVTHAPATRHAHVTSLLTLARPGLRLLAHAREAAPAGPRFAPLSVTHSVPQPACDREGQARAAGVCTCEGRGRSGRGTCTAG
eukprot:364708-Chlamydomonas_euryale.AAC.21